MMVTPLRRVRAYRDRAPERVLGKSHGHFVAGGLVRAVVNGDRHRRVPGLRWFECLAGRTGHRAVPVVAIKPLVTGSALLGRQRGVRHVNGDAYVQDGQRQCNG